MGVKPVGPSASRRRPIWQRRLSYIGALQHRPNGRGPLSGMSRAPRIPFQSVLQPLSLGDLVEGIALHAFEGKAPFTPETLDKIQQLKEVYGLTLTATGAHKLQEQQWCFPVCPCPQRLVHRQNGTWRRMATELGTGRLPQ